MTVPRFFTVAVSPKVETWSNKPYTVTLQARDRAAAIKAARAEYFENAQAFGQSAATYTARLATEQEIAEGAAA